MRPERATSKLIPLSGNRKINALFGQTEKYRRGSTVSNTPISGFKMGGFQSAMRASPVSESILMPDPILDDPIFDFAPSLTGVGRDKWKGSVEVVR